MGRPRQYVDQAFKQQSYRRRKEEAEYTQRAELEAIAAAARAFLRSRSLPCASTEDVVTTLARLSLEGLPGDASPVFVADF